MYGNKLVVKTYTYVKKKEIILPSFRSFVQRFSIKEMLVNMSEAVVQSVLGLQLCQR